MKSKKKIILNFFLLLIFSISSYAQVDFEYGYYINNQGKKIEGFVKNYDQRTNPVKITFKKSENDAAKQFSLDVVKEFAIYNKRKFIRQTLNIDQSSQKINTLEKNREPAFKKNTVFLEVLIEGKSSLFSYRNASYTLFFFASNNSEIKQLVYKRYLSEKNKLRYNDTFRKQLLDHLKCADFNFEKMENLEYVRKDLMGVFTEHNLCVESDYLTFEENPRKTTFKMAIRPRINYSGSSTPNPIFVTTDLTMDKKLGVGLGVETEIILPFNRNKWSIIAEVAYQNYRAQNSFETNNISGGVVNTKIDYASIEMPLGFRYYMFLSKEIKLFINTAYIFDFTTKNLAEFKRADDSVINALEFKTLGSLSGGIGLKYNKFSLELRHLTLANRAILYGDTKFNSTSLIMGYTIF